MPNILSWEIPNPSSFPSSPLRPLSQPNQALTQNDFSREAQEFKAFQDRVFKQGLQWIAHPSQGSLPSWQPLHDLMLEWQQKSHSFYLLSHHHKKNKESATDPHTTSQTFFSHQRPWEIKYPLTASETFHIPSIAPEQREDWVASLNSDTLASQGWSWLELAVFLNRSDIVEWILLNLSHDPRWTHKNQLLVQKHKEHVLGLRQSVTQTLIQTQQWKHLNDWLSISPVVWKHENAWKDTLKCFFKIQPTSSHIHQAWLGFFEATSHARTRPEDLTPEDFQTWSRIYHQQHSPSLFLQWHWFSYFWSLYQPDHPCLDRLLQATLPSCPPLELPQSHRHQALQVLFWQTSPPSLGQNPQTLDFSVFNQRTFERIPLEWDIMASGSRSHDLFQPVWMSLCHDQPSLQTSYFKIHLQLQDGLALQRFFYGLDPAYRQQWAQLLQWGGRQFEDSLFFWTSSVELFDQQRLRLTHPTSISFQPSQKPQSQNQERLLDFLEMHSSSRAPSITPPTTHDYFQSYRSFLQENDQEVFHPSNSDAFHLFPFTSIVNSLFQPTFQTRPNHAFLRYSFQHQNPGWYGLSHIQDSIDFHAWKGSMPSTPCPEPSIHPVFNPHPSSIDLPCFSSYSSYGHQEEAAFQSFEKLLKHYPNLLEQPFWIQCFVLFHHLSLSLNLDSSSHSPHPITEKDFEQDLVFFMDRSFKSWSLYQWAQSCHEFQFIHEPSPHASTTFQAFDLLQKTNYRMHPVLLHFRNQQQSQLHVLHFNPRHQVQTGPIPWTFLTQQWTPSSPNPSPSLHAPWWIHWGNHLHQPLIHFEWDRQRLKSFSSWIHAQNSSPLIDLFQTQPLSIHDRFHPHVHRHYWFFEDTPYEWVLSHAPQNISSLWTSSQWNLIQNQSIPLQTTLDRWTMDLQTPIESWPMDNLSQMERRCFLFRLYKTEASALQSIVAQEPHLDTQLQTLWPLLAPWKQKFDQALDHHLQLNLSFPCTLPWPEPFEQAWWSHRMFLWNFLFSYAPQNLLYQDYLDQIEPHEQNFKKQWNKNNFLFSQSWDESEASPCFLSWTERCQLEQSMIPATKASLSTSSIKLPKRL